MQKDKIADILLRVSLAFAFLYPPISAVFHPFEWIGYFPKFILINAPVPGIVLLHAFGVVEVIIALWILSGKKIFIPSLLAAIMLAVIVIFNFSQIDVVFRDIALCLLALSLAVKSFKNQRSTLSEV